MKLYGGVEVNLQILVIARVNCQLHYHSLLYPQKVPAVHCLVGE
jgi:hypothetical protein